MEIIGVIIAGIIIGLLGKFVAPSTRDNIPIWLTILCGIGGVIIGTISRSGIRRQRLEPCAGQLARTVLRGGGRSNAISLPDTSPCG